MELLSNLIWAVLSLVLLVGTWQAHRFGLLRVNRRSALVLAALVCILMLPILSQSDDVLEIQQMTLPMSAQTWHVASQDSALGLEILPLIALFLLLCSRKLLVGRLDQDEYRSAYSHWIARTYGMRPPPAFAL